MSPELVTVLSNAGPLGIALLVYLFHVMPSQQKDAQATRAASGKVLNAIAKSLNAETFDETETTPA